MTSVTFSIRETTDHNSVVVYEVWRRNWQFGVGYEGDGCLLAEATTRAEARELLRHYAAEEQARKAVQP